MVLGGVDGQGAGIAEIGDVVDHLEAVDEGAAGVGAALQLEADEAAGAVGEVLGCALGGEPVVVGRVDDPGDLGMAGEVVGDRAGVAAVFAHAQWEGLEALQREERVERAL